MEDLDLKYSSRFSWIDYCVFSLMLIISAAIGLYYGCVGKGMKDTKEFHLAGKSMSAFPVAMSLIASFMSAISLLGTPSEAYQTGMAYGQTTLAYIIAIPLTGYIFLPVFWNLQMMSTFEYLELRFSRAVRVLGSVSFIILTNIYMAFVIYAPSLALAQVTGINVFTSVSIITFVSMFYTALGGMKAVLWTDTLQTVLMYGGLFLVLIKGTLDLGGLPRVWEVNDLGNRTTVFDFNPDPRVRHTFWVMVFGQCFHWFSIFGVNQTQVQRYFCVSKISTVRKLMWISAIGCALVVGLSTYMGLLVYAKYVACDPLSSGVISRSDQLFPLFVMNHFGEYRGFPGIFLAGIFSGALSTVSSGINSLTAITLEDFLRKWNPNLSEEKATFYSKIMSVIYGIVAFILVIFASFLGDILSTTNSVTGIVHGQILAIFSLGMLFPNSNTKGVFIGTFTGIIMTAWMVLGQQFGIKNKQIALGKLPINVCDNFTIAENMTNTEILESFSLYQQEAEVLDPDFEPTILTQFYRISYALATCISCTISVIVGLIASLITGSYDSKKLDPRLFSPLVFWFRGVSSTVRDIGKDFQKPMNSMREELNDLEAKDNKGENIDHEFVTSRL